MGIELRGLGRRLGPLQRLNLPKIDARESNRDGRIILLRTGVGRHQSLTAYRQAIEVFSPDLILSIGVAGGLRHEFLVGDPFVVSSASLWPSDVETLSLEQALALPEVYGTQDIPLVAQIKGGRRVRRGRLLTVDNFVNSVNEKRKLASAGYDLVDMEFAAAVEASSGAGLPLTGLKVVSDSAQQGFPRYRFSADGERKGIPPVRLVAGSMLASRVLNKLVAAWLAAARR